MIRVVHPGSRIRILTFYPSRIQGSKRHRIPDPDPQHWGGHTRVRESGRGDPMGGGGGDDSDEGTDTLEL